MYYAAKLLDVEAEQREGKSLWKEFFGVRRNRRAAQSAFFVMFMQQFCGVNVIAYYRSVGTYQLTSILANIPQHRHLRLRRFLVL